MEIVNEVPVFQADAQSGIVPLALKLAEQNETFAVCYATEASAAHITVARRVQ